MRQRRTPDITMDRKAKAMYIKLTKNRTVRKTERHCGTKHFPTACIDYDVQGKLIGVEVLW